MEVHEAKAFLAVAEELHFGRAAATLRIAQPPLSRLIKSIEKSLGAQLFERSTRQVSLTPAGQALLDPARELVAASENARRAVAKSVSGETGRVRLGFLRHQRRPGRPGRRSIANRAAIGSCMSWPRSWWISRITSAAGGSTM